MVFKTKVAHYIIFNALNQKHSWYVIFTSRVNIALIKLLAFCALIAGKGILLCKKPMTFNIARISTIYINRSDRIGDAFVSLPFIEGLVQYLSRYQNLRVVILASTQNRNVFEKLAHSFSFIEISVLEKNISADYTVNPFALVIKWIRVFLKNSFSHRVHAIKKDIFIDLVWDPESIFLFKKIHPTLAIVGSNINLNSYILDAWVSSMYVGFSKQNLIESYLELIENTFSNGREISNFIRELHKDKAEGLMISRRQAILFFVWTKKYRNISAKKWIELIHAFSVAYPKYQIDVIDDPSNETTQEIASMGLDLPNARIIYNNFSISEFCNLWKQYDLVIGIDGGWMNGIRSHTRALTIFTTGNAFVWGQFSTELHTKTPLKSGWIYYAPTNWKSAALLKNSCFVPTFEVALESDFFNDFDSFELINIIRYNLLK